MNAWFQALWADLERFLNRVVEYLPHVVGAILILIAAWLIAKIFRYGAVRLLNAADELFERIFTQGGLSQLRIPDWASRLVGGLIFWIVILIGLEAATRVLDIPLATRWMDSLLGYIPTAIAVVVIAVSGVLVSILLRDLVTTGTQGAGVQQAQQLGIAVQVGALIVAATVGLDQLGIDVDLLIAVVAVVIAAGAGGLSLAFGLGARSYVANVLACRQVERLYRTGETVRIDGMQGIVEKVGPTFVIIGTTDGTVAVPAKLFLDQVSLAVGAPDDDGS
jgi:small-conductance mechanosensitive channel